MSELNGKGLIAGIIAWFLIIALTADAYACIDSVKGCKGDDFILSNVIAIGMLAPAGLIAYVVSGLLSSKD